MDSAKKLQLEGSWDQMRGRVREAWGDLTDDEVDQSKGQWDQLVGTIREKTGETAEAVERKLGELIDQVDEAGR